MTIYFTSDLHHSHKNIVEFTDRGKATTKEQHDVWLTCLWNSIVKKNDLVYHLGDFSFATKYNEIADFVARLNGRIVLLKGNHDREVNLQKLKDDNLIENWHMYKEIKVPLSTGEVQHIDLFHFPISSWHKQGYGAWHLYGHCVDLQTEILTKDGWKNRKDIAVNDQVITFNIESGQLENDSISDIIDVDYSGNVVVGNGKSYDFRFTENHTDIIRKSINGPICKIKAKDLTERNKTWMLLSGLNNSTSGFGLTLDELKLYIVIVADGSIKHETNLCRVKIKKPHKISYIKTLLKSLDINYNIYESKGYLSFNFYIPDNILKFRIKGLDDSVLNCTEDESKAIFEAYENSDGHKSGNTLIIYSAKEREIDLLQAMFCQNGYMTNKYSRFHGFSTNLQYQLSVTKKQETTFKSSTLKFEQVVNEHFWCVKTKNQTWVMRRNGVVKITGNCHGNHKSEGKSLDVGLDSAYNQFKEHRFFSLLDVEHYMNQRAINTVDHHRNHVD